MFRCDFQREVRLNPLCMPVCDCVKQVALESGFDSEGEQEGASQRSKTPFAVILSLPPCHSCDSARHSFCLSLLICKMETMRPLIFMGR